MTTAHKAGELGVKPSPGTGYEVAFWSTWRLWSKRGPPGVFPAGKREHRDRKTTWEDETREPRRGTPHY